MAESSRRIARVCAELIRAWHVHYGATHRPPNMDNDQFTRYTNLLSQFQNADIAEPRVQGEIANAQQSGVLEWFYGQPIPRELWQELTGEFELNECLPPRHLGEAAKWILENLDSSEGESSDHREDRLKVSAESHEAMVQQAREFYSRVAAEEVAGLGGVNALLACSLERYPWHEGGQVTLLSADALGLHIVGQGERQDDFVDAVRHRTIIVESAVGEPRIRMTE